jgi:hypothetical protein
MEAELNLLDRIFYIYVLTSNFRMEQLKEKSCRAKGGAAATEPD